MKLNYAAWALALALSSLSHFAQEVKKVDASEAAKTPAPAQKETAVLKTSEGEITVEFWPEVAPKTVENFKKLAREKFYDGTAFHRIIKGFMIQGGDPNTKDLSKEDIYGQGDPGYKIKAEFNERKHVRGVLSMARGGNPDSAGSQFFICLDAAPSLDRQYTTFGKVIKGEDVLMKLGNTPVGPNKYGEPSKPRKRVELQSVTIVPAEAAEKPADSTEKKADASAGDKK